MPDIEENELIARIEWNENIHVDENKRRVDELFKELKDEVLEQTASIGRQDFILNRERNCLLPKRNFISVRRLPMLLPLWNRRYTGN